MAHRPLLLASLLAPCLAVSPIATALAAPAVASFTLENGLRGVVITDNRAPVVTHMVWYPVGSADEPQGKSGIAHFLEHLMFKGTDEIPEGAFSKIIAENGGRDNAFTSYDYTGYFQRIASDRLELVMRMEADRMRDLAFTEAVAETEREVILEERNQRTENSPQALFSEQMNAALFQNHRYGIPIIGWRHEMEGLTRADALAFYERYYAPDNAVLVVAGDVEPAEVERLARLHYGPLEPSGRPPESRPKEPPHRAARRMTMQDPRVRQPYVMRQYLVPSRGSDDPSKAASLVILAQILGSGITSRFSEQLELGQKIAIDTGAWYSATARDATDFTIYAVPAAGIGLADVEAGLDAVLATMAETGPTEAELARIKRKIRASYIYAEDSQATLARRYGGALSAGLSLEEIAAWPEVLEAVTVQDVRAVAQTYLVPARSVTGWLTGDSEEQG
ncbi:MAG: pitrilysin family protein [Pseudomonadota bacterium]